MHPEVVNVCQTDLKVTYLRMTVITKRLDVKNNRHDQKHKKTNHVRPYISSLCVYSAIN
jgi:hypothetical protein